MPARKTACMAFGQSRARSQQSVGHPLRRAIVASRSSGRRDAVRNLLVIVDVTRTLLCVFALLTTVVTATLALAPTASAAARSMSSTAARSKPAELGVSGSRSIAGYAPTSVPRLREQGCDPGFPGGLGAMSPGVNRAGCAASVGAAVLAAKCSQAYLPLPDPACTPGALNPDVTQATIDQTICVSGWTSTIRPPTSYTNPLKQQGITDYGYTDTTLADYEEDHFLPLELGGAPRDPKNLWPEPHYGTDTADNKDRVENAVKNAVCAGQVSLNDAQQAMLTNWTTAESVLGIASAD